MRASVIRHPAASMFLIGMLLLPSLLLASECGPRPARQPLTPDGRMQLSDVDRCPVCAMFPARYPQTAAAMTLKKGPTFYFCTNGCLLRTWLRPRVYLGRPSSEIGRLVVRDYFTGRPVDARTATWVAGSDVIGPMGPAVIALGDPDHLATFKKRHGAAIVFRFDQLDDALWKRISRHTLPAVQTE